jgi:fatty-acyl-CoA synthase
LSRRPRRPDRRDRGGVRRLVLRRALRRHLAGSAALPTSFGGKDAYIDQLAVQLKSADPALLIYPPELTMAGTAAEVSGVAGIDWASFFAEEAAPVRAQGGQGRRHRLSAIFERLDALPARRGDHPPRLAQQPRRPRPFDEHRTEGDRGVSWLPFYHDMGLVGCMLSMIANQMSVDYLKTEDFARRPLAWLDLVTRNKEQTMSYSPTFGYDICARRVSSQTDVAGRFDLSRWRVAGNGADMIRPDVMQAFVDTFAPAGFDARSFLPSYGLAEATLAVSVMPPGRGHRRRAGRGDPARRRRPGRARPAAALSRRRQLRRPVRGMEVAIRGDDDSVLGEREIGRVLCRGTRSWPAISATRRRPTPASTPKIGWTPATWATCRTAISTSSAAPRT